MSKAQAASTGAQIRILLSVATASREWGQILSIATRLRNPASLQKNKNHATILNLGWISWNREKSQETDCGSDVYMKGF